jgi:hypothetical protein
MTKIMQKKFWIGTVIIIFGALTVISGGKSLFIESRGEIVPLVLWFNFIAGFLYLIAGISVFKLKTCVKKLAIVLATLNVFVLLYLVNHIIQGGLYENKTLVAMSFRTAFWVFFAIYFYKSEVLKKIECDC